MMFLPPRFITVIHVFAILKAKTWMAGLVQVKPGHDKAREP